MNFKNALEKLPGCIDRRKRKLRNCKKSCLVCRKQSIALVKESTLGEQKSELAAAERRFNYSSPWPHMYAAAARPFTFIASAGRLPFYNTPVSGRHPPAGPQFRNSVREPQAVRVIIP